MTTLIAKLSLSFDNKIFEKMDEILEEYKNQKKQLPYKELQELITNNKNKQVGNLINLREYIKLSKESPKNSKQKQSKKYNYFYFSNLKFIFIVQS